MPSNIRPHNAFRRHPLDESPISGWIPLDVKIRSQISTAGGARELAERRQVHEVEEEQVAADGRPVNMPTSLNEKASTRASNRF
ncbi:unnamed protein product [Heligmosomoides polygyrus]|uniref:Uncharacterized protein n=1 Tax=Heligmosomoides polygyrus TaxID=6339 RepID=A0A3P7ZN86_HELPZ|nr:unnamed protein product [Heligmosomoides polygyrus]